MDACRLSEEDRKKLLTATQGVLTYSEITKHMKRIRDPMLPDSASMDGDEVRRRADMSMQRFSHSIHLGEHDDSQHEDHGSDDAYDEEAFYTCDESDDCELAYEVDESDIEEFEELFTMKQKATKGLRKFRKRMYRPSQSKRRWNNASSSSSSFGKGKSKGRHPDRFRRQAQHTYVTEHDHHDHQHDTEDVHFTPKVTPKGAKAQPGKNPIDSKTGKRMLCRGCGSADHFVKACPKGVHEQRFVTSDSEAEIEVTSICM